MTDSKTLKITMVKALSLQCPAEAHLIALGLRKHHQGVMRYPGTRGMIRAVAHLVTVEEVNKQ
jgi:ribosomal protein L30/L7E